jgi:hypothetical protein
MSGALLTKLLHAIARVVHYKIEQLDIMAGGYTPQAVYDHLQRQHDIQSAAIDVLSGKKPLLINVQQPRNPISALIASVLLDGV